MRLLSLILTFVLAGSAQAATLHVDPAATGAADGTSWADAYVDLQDALRAAAFGDEIWVAAGTYFPTTSAQRGWNFMIPSGVQVYGGFAGTELARDSRDPQANPTILSGDLGERRPDGADYDPAQSWAKDNAYRVVLIANVDPSTVLDGFVVQEGVRGMDVVGGAPKVRNATVRFNHDDANGGGVLIRSMAAPEFTDVVIERNSNTTSSGGGVRSDASSKPRFERVVFRENSSGIDGGGMSGRGTFVDVDFVGNRALSGRGGGLAGGGSLVNVSFDGNESATAGGGFWAPGGVSMQNVLFTANVADQGAALHLGVVPGNLDIPGTPSALVNLTVTGNVARAGAIVSADGTDISLVNSVLADRNPVEWISLNAATAAVSRSLIQGSGGSGAGWNSAWGTDLGGNVDNDPSFVGTGDYHLDAASVAIDAGDNGALMSGDTDLDGNPRVHGPAVDMGAFEFQGEPGGGEETPAGFAAALSPQTLNVASRGRSIELRLSGSGDAAVEEVDPMSLRLGGVAAPVPGSDGFDEGDLVVKFDRAECAAMLTVDGFVDIAVSGSLYDGTPLEATARLRVIGNGAGGASALANGAKLRAWPNPFNPATEISFDLARGGPVELTIYDLSGRRVKTLVSGTRAAGEHSEVWHGRDDSGRFVASGTYLAHLRTANSESVERLILVK